MKPNPDPRRLVDFQKSDDGLYRRTVVFGQRRPRRLTLVMTKTGRLKTEKSKQTP